MITLPTDEEIVRWSNEESERSDDEKKYTATGSRIAIHERCEGARWVVAQLRKQLTPQQTLFK